MIIGFAIAARTGFKQYSWWGTAALLSGMHLLGSGAGHRDRALPAAHDWVTHGTYEAACALAWARQPPHDGILS